VFEGCFVAAETGKGLEERVGGLFVVRIGLGSPSASVVGIGRVAVGSPAAEKEIQLVVVHNPLAVTKIQKRLGILLAEMPKRRDAVRENQWAGEVFPRQNRIASEG